MNKTILEIEYACDSQDEASLIPFFSALEHEIGGQRRCWASRKGAIDLATFIEITISLKLIVKATFEDALKAYISGFIGVEGAKELGSRHRSDVLKRLAVLRSDFVRIISALKKRFREGLHAPQLGGKDLPIAICIDIGTSCFVVLNGPHTTEASLDQLPYAMGKLLSFIEHNGLPPESGVLQLCLDPTSNSWRYLLVPSMQSFGHFVDRIVDLKTGELLLISSPQEFIALLQITEKDGLMFLVDPYRYQN